MKRPFLYTLFALSAMLLSLSCGKSEFLDSEMEEVLSDLNGTIDRQTEIQAGKASRISSIEDEIGSHTSEMELYHIYDRLFAEFYQYNIDSAIFYCKTKLAIAERLGDSAILNDAVIDIADRYILSGMYTEANALMGTIVPESLGYSQLPQYMHLYQALYEGLEHRSDDLELREKYSSLKKEYRMKLLEKLGEDDIAKFFVHSEILLEQGKTKTVLDMTAQWREYHVLSEHDLAVLNYIAAKAYNDAGNRRQAMIHYAKSAIHDLSTPVCEYRSLYELSYLLYEEGELELAYRYITRSINDAMAANAKINIDSINKILPITSRAYRDQMVQKNRLRGYLLLGISILLLMLSASLAIMFRERRKVSNANVRLRKYVELLSESNNIKETYLGRYLDLCSGYIEGLDRYRSGLRKASKEGGYSEILSMLKSNDFMENELKEFYAQFDATFMELFPTFITELNGLLQPDRRIDLKTKGSILTTEVRICALIRLGVTDSVRIAKFLRRSVSTIYNYRVKMRNSALNSREDFEKQLMHIGTPIESTTKNDSHI